MSTKITFTLDVEKEKFDDVISNIQRIDELELREDKNKKGSIMCIAILPEDNAERAVNLCGSMFSIDGVKSIDIFTTVIPDKEIKKSNRFIPFVPMIISSTITFLMMFSVLTTFEKDVNWLEVFYLVGIPTIVVFLSQLAYVTQELWLYHIKKIPSK